VQLFIKRIEQHDAALNAVVVRSFEAALARAREADQAQARGESWGVLHGLPMTVKEAFDVPGMPTTWGFETFKSNIPKQAAQAVQRLLDAGAIVLGKTNVPVALGDWQTFNPVYGTTNNPWDIQRGPGGSSGGSAAALAAGLTPLELGSDIGASIRNPAHYCGVYGHKPSWGVVSMAGHELPGVACIDHLDIGVVGPMSRSAQDLRLTMDVLASPLQLFGLHGWQAAQWRKPRRELKDLRIGFIFDDEQAPVDAQIQDQLKALAEFLKRQGFAIMMNSKPVESASSHRTYMHLLRAATGAMLDDASYEQMKRRADASDPSLDTIRERTWRGSALSHRDWFKFDQHRAQLRTQWQQYFESVDLLIAPIATSTAFAHNHVGERWERMITVNGKPQPSTDSLFWAGLPGVVGLPATAIPIGLSHEGLPIGSQIIGPALSDPQCIDMAQWLEKEWYGFVPPPLFS
jgi:amidase